MTKWSGVPPNSSPALADFLMGVTAGNVDDRVTLQNILTLFFNNIPTGAILLGKTYATANDSGIGGTEVQPSFGSVTVTVPTGGRSVLLKVVVPNGNTSGGSGDQIRFYFKEGSTYLNTATFAPANTFGQMQNFELLLSGALLPSAGVHTYTIGIKRTNGAGAYATNYGTTSPDIAIPYFAAFLI